MKTELIDISNIKLNKDNPRVIRDDKYKKLVQSIKEFPKMLDIRPIVVDENMIVLGGNMRLKACKEAGLKEVPVIKVDDLTETEKTQFILKDNKSFGDWDYGLLKDWDKDFVIKSGFDEWELWGIYGYDKDNDYERNIREAGVDINKVDVNDYIKQNVFFLNEFMLEFEDDEVKQAVRNLNDISTKEQFIRDLKKVIIHYGKNSI